MLSLEKRKKIELFQKNEMDEVGHERNKKKYSLQRIYFKTKIKNKVPDLWRKYEGSTN